MHKVVKLEIEPNTYNETVTELGVPAVDREIQHLDAGSFHPPETSDGQHKDMPFKLGLTGGKEFVVYIFPTGHETVDS